MEPTRPDPPAGGEATGDAQGHPEERLLDERPLEEPSLDQQIEAHYRAQRLPGASVERILDRARAAGTRATARSPRPMTASSWRLWAVAAILMTGLAFALLIATGAWPDGDAVDPTARVIAEVATNHRKASPNLIDSARYGEVQARLDRLDFLIEPSRTDIRERFALLGGRYCSLQGDLAAQLKVRHLETGSIHTLYVAEVGETLRGVAPASDIERGVAVEIWRDGDRLFALAGEPAD